MSPAVTGRSRTWNSLRSAATAGDEAARAKPGRSGSLGYNQTATSRLPSAKITARSSVSVRCPARALAPSTSSRRPNGQSTTAA